jgi:hypothetical protein
MLCENYLKYPGDPKRAAKEAGYVSGNISALQRPHVKAYLQLLQDALSEKSKITAERAISEIGKIAFSNLQDFMSVDEETGIPHFDFRNTTRDQWACLTEFTEDVTGGQNDGERRLVIRQRAKIGGKIQALELLAKHFALLTEKHEHSFSDEVIAKLNEGRQRVIEHREPPKQLEQK